MKKLEIKKTKPTLTISVLKVQPKVVLVSSISDFFTNKTSLANKWTSFSSSNLALAISKYRKQIVKLHSYIIMCIYFSLICPILETMPEIFKENRWLFGGFEDTKIPFWYLLTN